jgi:ABC-2 type transport system permease protein
MKPAGAVALVAGREMKLRGRSRAFIVSSLVLALGVVAIIVATSIVRDHGGRAHLDVGVVAGADITDTSLLDAGDAVDTNVDVHDYADQDAADAALHAGEIDVSISATAVTWHEAASDIDNAIVRSALRSSAVETRAAQLGIPSSTLTQLLAPVDLPERVLEPESSESGVRVATATIGVIVLFIAIQTYGNFVLNGVIEEKSSRVVEVLLNHVRPRQLLAGKIIGLGALGLLQMLFVLAGALVALFAVRDIHVPKVPVDALVWFVVWFLLGFALYATAFAMAGSLVSRQEDAASVVTPVMLPFLGSYFASFAIAGSPDTTFAKVLSIVPVTAPMTMPVRIAAGHPSAGEIALSLVLTIAAIVALIRLAGRVYARNLLRTGARQTWGAALRSLRA